MVATEAQVVKALRNGAVGYVLKSAPGSELFKAIRGATATDRYLSPEFTARVLEAANHPSADPEDVTYERLTPRERQVLHLVAEGFNGTAIAKQLYISSRTVETHRQRAMHKLGIRSQTELVLFALRRGLLPQPDGPPMAARRRARKKQRS
jgi:two-component system response regulator NreC